MRALVMLLCCLAIAFSICNKAAWCERALQEQLYQRSEQSNWATIPLQCWSDFTKATPTVPPTIAVVGTGFLINSDGYFITAAHVAKVDHYGSVQCELRAEMRQADQGAYAAHIEWIEIDVGHDLALGRIFPFSVHDINKPTKFDLGLGRKSWHPFASLAISRSKPRQGEMVLLSGYPLGSLLEEAKLGIVSATSILYFDPPIGFFVKDSPQQLLQVTISGNHGDSGGPLVDLTTGNVIGVLI